MKRNLMVLAIVFFIIGCLLILVYLVVLINSNSFSWKGKFDFETSGQFGDFVGGVIGTFWSASGLILLYVNYRLQKKEFKKTQDSIQYQIIQASIITMIDDLNNYIKSIEYTNVGHMFTEHNKERFFIFLKDEMLNDLDYLNQIVADSSGEEKLPISCADVIDNIQNNILKRNNQVSEILVKFIIKIKGVIYALVQIKNIDNSQILFQYFKSQLDKNQIAVIFYYSLTDDERKKGQLFDRLKESNFFTTSDANALYEPEHITEYGISLED